MMSSSSVRSLYARSIVVFDALDDYGSMVDGINMCSEELL